MSIPSTAIYDHIVHLTSPGQLKETTEYFEQLGFNVIVGGVHANGLTENSLVILPDYGYLELIAFTHEVDHYPAGSPEREERVKNRWADKKPGWIDYANLGTSPTLSEIINSRAESEDTSVRYLAEVPGGRNTPAGKELKWLITQLDDKTVTAGKGAILPFFCGDVTPREWRVPEPSSGGHKNKATGIAHIRILTLEDDIPEATKQITAVIGSPPLFRSTAGVVWPLKVQHETESQPQLILNFPRTDEEVEYVSERGAGVYEVAFRVDSNERAVHSSDKYGRILIIPLTDP